MRYIFQAIRSWGGIVLLVMLLGLTACENGLQTKPVAQPPPTQQPTVTTTQGVTSPLPTPTTIVEQATPTPELIATLPLSPTLTLPAPTLTPLPTTLLPPLDEDLQTIVYTVNGPQGPEIYRVQVDELGQKAGPVARIDFQTHPQIRILGLFPSPNGQQVAVGWLRDTGTTHVYILEVATGQLTPLFGQADIDQRATFLDWTPDSQSVLVMGGTANPDLGNSAWLVNVESHTYRDVNIKQINELPRIRDASFSPDGETIIYTHRDNIQGGSEIWKITLDETTPQLLIKNTKYRIENVLWSPEGDSIAFTQWSEDIKPSINEIRMGELHVIQQDGSQERTLSSIVIHADNQIFRPIWSPDGQQIAFVSSENLESGETLDTLSGNLYIANVSTNQIRQITRLERNVVIRPAWSPDSFEIAFLLKEQSQNQFDSQVIEINSAQLRQFGLNESLIETQINQVDGSAPNLDERSAIVWLP